ncbi:hypothetical protein THRCLA_06391 [Thraustotheca clavata]|uniref:Uncharacterized protein n=1 Tax=Thraustotheca clavata TaxID=74557 RepID=A0A1V9ZP58_9STRA|nr:hypothetical protein THRCLA_06391 [Thraustotheca clavata]
MPLPIPKRVTAAQKHLSAMKANPEHMITMSGSCEWRTKYLGKLHINHPPEALERKKSAPIMIPSKHQSPAIEYDTDSLLSWENPSFMNSMPSSSDEDGWEDDILFDDDVFGFDTQPVEQPPPARRRSEAFIPPHQLVERDCFSLGVQRHFRKKITPAI